MNETKVRVGVSKGQSDIHLCPGQNLYTGIKKFEEEFNEFNSLEEDVLNVAAGVFGTDLSIPRYEREHFIRNINITIEVVNYHAFDRVKQMLENALHLVSKDNWTITFIQKAGLPVSDFEWKNTTGAVLLFSGGLDSMCAASELIRKDENLVLVSHNTPGNHVVDKCQRDVHELLEKHYSKTIKHIHVKVYGRNQGEYLFPKDDGRENTQRTRSFLFLSLAALITRRSGFNKVLFMGENGQFAIHLPLNQARVGPFSTHTADPEFVLQTQDIFKILLGNEHFEIQNPFLYKTKGEVFSLLPKELQNEAKVSASCWMISRIEGNKHCGYCIPCISRRIATEFNGVKFKEYETDIFKIDVTKLPDTKDQKRNLTDYLEFVSRFKEVNQANKRDILNEFPELYNLTLDTDQAIDMYRRVSEQSFQVFQKYPKVIKLIG